MGATLRSAVDGSPWDLEAFVISIGLHSQEPKITRECKRERSPLRTSGSLLQLATLAALTGHTTTAGCKRYEQPELANSLFHTGSATGVPADGDFLAPAMRSTGFKTDLIPQPARVPPNPRELSAPKELSRLGMAPVGGLGLWEGGYCGLAKPLRQVFLLFFARCWARVLPGSRRDGQPQRAELWEGSGCGSLRSEARRKKKKMCF